MRFEIWDFEEGGKFGFCMVGIKVGRMRITMVVSDFILVRNEEVKGV